MSGNKKNVDPPKKQEEDCSCYAESRSERACPPVRRVTHPLRYYEFTQDEIKALEECDKESFYRRCLPLSALFATATVAAIRYGYLKPNARFGAVPKVTLAVVVGYFLGKLSYQQACADKLMALPGSYIGQLLRDRRDGKTSVLPKQSPTMFGVSPGDIYSDAGPGSSLDLDTERPLFNEDSYQPGGESDVGSAPKSPAARPALSYEELRRKNRSEYSEARQDPYRTETGLPPLYGTRAPPPPPPPPSPPQPQPRANRYGDVVE